MNRNKYFLFSHYTAYNIFFIIFLNYFCLNSYNFVFNKFVFSPAVSGDVQLPHPWQSGFHLLVIYFEYICSVQSFAFLLTSMKTSCIINFLSPKV